MIKKEWFYRNSEGYLGANEEASVLFILREPNSGGEDVNDNKFWFRDVVNGIKKNDRYLGVLGREACLLLGMSDSREALKRCAYINLHPDKGKGSLNKDYKECRRKLKSGVKDTLHRWDIINNLPAGTFVVTMDDIADAIKGLKKRDESSLVKDHPRGFRLKNKGRQFKSFSFRGANGEITVYPMYHPSARGKNWFDIKDIDLE